MNSMEMNNFTFTSVFTLRGFSLDNEENTIVFVLFLLIYLFSITSNVLIIYLVYFNRNLHRPMYFFLSNFSFLEIWYISVTVPKMMADFLNQRKVISAVGCFLQFYFLFFFGSTENLLLAIMSFDRYVAICYPLRYVMMMTNAFCKTLAVVAWVVSAITVMVAIIPLTRMSFCVTNKIDHVFCDFSPLVKISCQGAWLSEIIFFPLAGFVILGCFILILASYIHIILTVFATSSHSELRNTFTTCASHFMVVFIYYGTVIFMYVRPSAMLSYKADKVVSVFYSAVTPLLNPIIYSLRNREVREAIKKTFTLYKSTHIKNATRIKHINVVACKDEMSWNKYMKKKIQKI